MKPFSPKRSIEKREDIFSILNAPLGGKGFHSARIFSLLVVLHTPRGAWRTTPRFPITCSHLLSSQCSPWEKRVSFFSCLAACCLLFLLYPVTNRVNALGLVTVALPLRPPANPLGLQTLVYQVPLIGVFLRVRVWEVPCVRD